MTETRELAMQDGERALARREEEIPPEVLVAVLQNDLRGLAPRQLGQYILARCHAEGLDPAMKPYELIEFTQYEGGQYVKKLQLYATANWATQVADKRNLSSEFSKHEEQGDFYVVVCRVWTPGGRSVERRKLIHLFGKSKDGGKYRLTGEAYANAVMKCETAAFRRAVRALVGTGAVEADEERVQQGRIVTITEQGEVIDQGPVNGEQSALPAQSPETNEDAACLQQLREEWLRQKFAGFETADGRALFRDYGRRALNREPVRAAEDPAGFVRDVKEILADLLERVDALREFYATEKEHVGSSSADEMRENVSVALGYEVKSRKNLTARELRWLSETMRAEALAEVEAQNVTAVSSPATSSDPIADRDLWGEEAPNAPVQYSAVGGSDPFDESDPGAVPAAASEPNPRALFMKFYDEHGGKKKGGDGVLLERLRRMLPEPGPTSLDEVTADEWVTALIVLQETVFKAEVPSAKHTAQAPPLAFQ